MPGNTDKNSDKKTVQTLLAAKKGSDKQPSKRPNAEVSMDSSSDLAVEMANLQQDLCTIKDSLEGIVKKPDLNSALNDIVKKSDLETVVTSIVSKLIDDFRKEFNQKLFEKTSKQTEAIENLSRENQNLRELISEQRIIIKELETHVSDNEMIAKEALKMSNYNEQYSRKFNIKVMNYPEKPEENLRNEFITKIVKDKLNVTVVPSEIQAIHRIPGKDDGPRPILVKVANSEVKYRIMKEKKNLPKEPEGCLKLVDDVTRHNMGLISRLWKHDKVEGAWYYNCSVYAKTKAGKRMKFDIFDDLSKKL